MYVYQYGYRCERCGFTIQAFICNRHINRDEAESIILHDTNILDGFSKNDGTIRFVIAGMVEAYYMKILNSLTFRIRKVGNKYYELVEQNKHFTAHL